MRLLISLLLIIQGAIHFIGFAASFPFAFINQMSEEVPRINGTLWLIAVILFLSTALLVLFKKEFWWMISVPAVSISQYLIFTGWNQAKFGTLINAMILIASVIGFVTWRNSKKLEMR